MGTGLSLSPFKNKGIAARSAAASSDARLAMVPIDFNGAL
jgi:hypothetical protein